MPWVMSCSFHGSQTQKQSIVPTKYPNAAKALLMAVMEAQQWCDKPENRDELAGIVANL
jgi:hypothetical protein